MDAVKSIVVRNRLHIVSMGPGFRRDDERRGWDDERGADDEGE